MSLPLWLQEVEAVPLPEAVRPRRADYLERTLQSIQAVFREEMLQARLSERSGSLQGMEVRCKLIAVVILLLSVALGSSPTALAGVQGALLVAALGAGIPLKTYMTRVWLPALIFSGVAGLPAILSWITPGEPLLVLIPKGQTMSVFPQGLAITVQGVKTLSFLLLRTTDSLAVVLLLLWTTRWGELMKALRHLGVPGIFVMTLELTYRYLFFFLLLLDEYLLGRRSRVTGRESAQGRISWIGGAVAGFFRLSGEYCREVASAMQARGYSGEALASPPAAVRGSDMALLAVALLIAVAAWGGKLV